MSKVSQLDFAERWKGVLFREHHRSELVAYIPLDVFLEYQVGDYALYLVVGGVLTLPLEGRLKILCVAIGGGQ